MNEKCNLRMEQFNASVAGVLQICYNSLMTTKFKLQILFSIFEFLVNFLNGEHFLEVGYFTTCSG